MAGRRMVVKFTHVRAHQGMDAGRQAVGNEYADRYANKVAEEGSDTINGYIHDANAIIEEIMTSLWTETAKEIDLKYHISKYENTSTKSTMTNYMLGTRSSDRNKLIDNANKRPVVLEKEAFEAWIVELQIEVAKQDEIIGALEENNKGLKKCILAQETALLKYKTNPKEGQYTSVHIKKPRTDDNVHRLRRGNETTNTNRCRHSATMNREKTRKTGKNDRMTISRPCIHVDRGMEY